MLSSEPTQLSTSTFEEPLGIPLHHTYDSPSRPQRCAHRSPRNSREAAWADAVAAAAAQTRSTYSTHSAHNTHNTAHDRVSAAHKSVSMSSAGASSTLTVFSAADPEKGGPLHTSRQHSREPSTYTIDQEKAAYLHASANMPRLFRASRRPDSSSSSTIYSLGGELNPGQEAQEQHALKILLFLAFPVVGLSWLLLFWLFIALFITTLSQPVRLCARRLSYSQQLSSLLGPGLNLQLKSIYTPLLPHANEDGNFSAGNLVFVLACAPLLSMGVAIAAWVVAAYWLMAGIVGDPAGMDKRDDGKETVLGLRRWWEAVLIRAVVTE